MSGIINVSPNMRSGKVGGFLHGQIITHSDIATDITGSNVDTSSESFEVLSGIEISLTTKLRHYLIKFYN